MTVKVKKVAAYRDGGTIHYTDKQNKSYYKDGRIGTKTKGQIYDKYPDDRGAKILDVTLKEVETF